jgi:thioredoxin-like negative regulator of GroEL
MNKGILYFSAPWCEPCKVFGPILESAIKQKRIGLKKINIDYDVNFVEKYGVKSVPTIILTDGAGNEQKRLMGNQSLETVLNFIG